MIVLDCVQGSPAWQRARLGVVTASAVTKIITPAKLELSKQRNDYMNRLLAEWVTGEPCEEFAGNHWTERGHELEGEARAAFAWETNLDAKAVGFIYRNVARVTGCSPDWFNLDESWGLELKCPAAHTHIGYLRCGGVPLDYVPQVQFSLWVTDVDRWFFMSYHPNLPHVLCEVEPDERWQEALDRWMPAFLYEMRQEREALLSLSVKPAMEVAA